MKPFLALIAFLGFGVTLLCADSPKLEGAFTENESESAFTKLAPNLEARTFPNMNWAARIQDTKLRLEVFGDFEVSNTGLEGIPVLQAYGCALLLDVFVPMLLDLGYIEILISRSEYVLGIFSVIGVGYLLSFADTLRRNNERPNKWRRGMSASAPIPRA